MTEPTIFEAAIAAAQPTARELAMGDQIEQLTAELYASRQEARRLKAELYEEVHTRASRKARKRARCQS